ncbi:Cadherin-7 [Pteropus alecto]|uniref:Cadherin-7 n=1 Tax=Pteropus alecto TaxID=9402 RepID=L5KKN5_PTEAL|nr:Cadherin-7 [Pteropus alecto]
MKLGKAELCHLLQLIALFLCFSGMSQAELSRSRSKPYFPSGRPRTKRSWVWNQFFVLEEYMGSDPLYVGKESLFGVPDGDQVASGVFVRAGLVLETHVSASQELDFRTGSSAHQRRDFEQIAH